MQQNATVMTNKRPIATGRTVKARHGNSTTSTDPNSSAKRNDMTGNALNAVKQK